MGILTVTVGYLRENAYIVYDEQTKDAAVIDPGGRAQDILNLINEHSLTLKYILLTHGHYDHTSAAAQLQNDAPGPVALLCHEDERGLLENRRQSLAAHSITPDMTLADGDTVNVGRLVLSVIHTPGHTAGSCCYYDAKNGVLFTGDTLFRMSVGRTDFPTGDQDALLSSIRDKLYVLDDGTRCLPGHEEETTVGYEKSHNPYTR